LILKVKDREIKILIVDDDEAIGSILKDLLSGPGKRVDVCLDGLAAVERMQECHYDLIITDLVMPGMSGLDVLKYAKKVNEHVIVIIITGFASLETAVSAIKDGAYDYITKPCKLAEINIVVDNALDKIKLIRENRKLLEELQDAYNELVALKEHKSREGKVASINFFSSNMPSLHYMLNRDSNPQNYVNELQALSALRDSGKLTEEEFKSFKGHLLKAVCRQDSEKRAIHE
jgi:DNA-binding response OmpR family regulator